MVEDGLEFEVQITISVVKEMRIHENFEVRIKRKGGRKH